MSWRRQFLPTAVTHPQAHVPWAIYNAVKNPLCGGWASNPKLHLLPFKIVKSALHRQVENWYCFSGSIPPSGAVRKPLGQVKKGLGSSQVSCLGPWSDPKTGIILCIGVTKMTMANGCSGSLAKGTTLHNGSKCIFALAPELFYSSGQVQPSWHFVTLFLGFGPTWAPPSSHRAPSFLPFPHPQPALPIPTFLSTTDTPRTHNEYSAHRMKSVSRNFSLERYFHRESKAQILTAALLFTQISSPALKLYLSPLSCKQANCFIE